MPDSSALNDIIQKIAFYQAGGRDPGQDPLDKVNRIIGSANSGINNYQAIQESQQNIINKRLQAKKMELENSSKQGQLAPYRDIVAPANIGSEITPGAAASPEAQSRIDSLMQKRTNMGAATLEQAKTAAEIERLGREKAPNQPLSTRSALDSGYARVEELQRLFPNQPFDKLGEIPVSEVLAQRSMDRALTMSDKATSRLEARDIRTEERTASRDAEKMSADQEKSVKNMASIESYFDEYNTELEKISPGTNDFGDLVMSYGKSLGSDVPVAGTAFVPEISAFNKFREASRAKIAKALDDVGNMSEVEQENAINLLSDTTTSKAEREQNKILFKNILVKSAKRAQDVLSAEKATRAQGFLNKRKLTGGGGMDQPPQNTGEKTQDQEALNWANANPNDPRAAAIKAKATHFLGGR